MTAPADAALGGLGFAAFSAGGLAFGYFVQGFRWSGDAVRSLLVGARYSRRASRIGLAFWGLCVAVGLSVATISGGVALVEWVR